MNKIKGRFFASAAAYLISAAFLLWGTQGHAQLVVADPEIGAGKVTVVEGSAWARVLPSGIAAGYMTLNNSSHELVDLVSASTLKNYGRVALHHSVQESGVVHMKKTEVLPIPACGQLVLAPGGFHLMLLQPKHKLVQGDEITLFLTFSSGQTLKVMMPVRKITGAH